MSCEKQATSAGKVVVHITFEDEEAGRVIVRGIYNLWLRFEKFAKESSNEITIRKTIENPEYYYINFPDNSMHDVQCFLEKGDSVSIRLKGRSVIFEGDDIPARQNQLLQQILQEKARHHIYKREMSLYQIMKQRNDNIEEPELVTIDMISHNVARLIEDFRTNNKGYSESFLRFVEMDIRHYKILSGLDLPQYNVKTYYPFSDSDLLLLEDVLQDTRYDEVVYSSNFRQLLNAYLDYLRIEDPKDFLGDGKEYILNEVRLADYIDNPTIKEYIVAGNLLSMVYEECDNPEYISAIKEYGGRWKEFLMKETNERINFMEKREVGTREFPALQGVTSGGDSVTLEQYRGRWTYIDIWATWCGHCNFELPYLEELEHRLSDYPIQFIGISVDSEKDIQKWKDFLIEKGLDKDQLLCTDKTAVYSQFGIKGIPHFAIIDPEGRLVYKSAPRPSTGIPERLLKAL
ncbi:MAG: TlpA disulfide reductase family protein [Bacteroidota bacterium]